MDANTLSRKEQIRKAAQKSFSEIGYAATSIRHLAREVGIEPASIYSHIRSKSDILSEICFQISGDFIKAKERVESQFLEPAGKLKMAIISHLEVIQKNASSCAIFFQEWRHLEADEYAKFKSMRREYESYFGDIVRYGKSVGSFRDIKESVFLPSLFASMNWTYHYFINNQNADLKEIAEAIYQQTLNGIINNSK